MSRKILKIGTDVLTLNDKLVSVKEDYPFWKVNLDTTSQYYQSLLNDARVTDNSTPEYYTSVGFGGGASDNVGGVLGLDGITIYTIPSSGAIGYKFNTVTKTITPYINISGTTKFSSACVVGKYIFLIPSSHTSIVRHDTETGVNTSIGSFAGTGKWGKATLAPNGKIYCPPASSAQWLIINVNDPENVTTSLVNAPAGISNLSQTCSTYSNGFVYSFSVGATNNRNMQKMNISNDTPTSSIFLGLTNYRSCININGIIYAISTNTGTSMLLVDTNNSDSTSTITILDYALNSVGLGADNEIYFLNTGGGGSRGKFNILSNTFSSIDVPPTPIAPGVATSWGSSGVVTNILGETYSIPWGGQNGTNVQYFWRINSATSEPLNPNRVLSRNINKNN